ncbi:MAG: hypothetical protein ACKOX2_12835, partial [Microcystaceae cyanobacterium]
MAQLSEETQAIVLDLQKSLLMIIHEASFFQFTILENYGETEATLSDLEQLDNVQQRADTYYSRLSTLLRQIAASQPLPT